MDVLPSLVEQAQLGDRGAYGRLVENLHGEVVAFVAARLPRAGLVEEVVQETFIAGFIGIADYRPDAGEFIAWIKGIARNRVHQAVADLRRRRAHTPVSRLDALFASEEDSSSAWDLERLQECLKRLSAPARALLDARYHDSEAIEAIAARLDRAYATIANQLCRIRTQLRQCLGG